ncbi:angiopoietin-related protein 6 precursor [Danio rerio]|uniref:Angiopoietin-like 6 n=1 Tax=Danio rerio TaxID=7955 RepID=Q5KQT8_DANRE|nr:angiopoietin-related protein 6 precursor [Danio rerio]BAD86840.1 angiopoietin-like 6 [Danio rerio]|eukprot:NP_001014821.1 angiopoietin-related protein 6 precursor [Danio rerio]
MEIPASRALLFLLFCAGLCCVDGRKESVGSGSSKGDDANQKRPSRASETKQSRCSYTFIVPQQKLTGALCLITESARVNRSEVASLRALLERQQDQLDQMRGRLEEEGTLASEMRILRRESVNMNARIAQLYAQLLSEIIQKKEQVEEQRRLEGLLLNATSQLHQVSSNYRDLEKKYDTLASLVNNQSKIITLLEKQCQLKTSTKELQEATSLPAQQSSVLVNINTEPKDVQRDQSAPFHQAQARQELLETFDDSPGPPTETPFISFPSTKSPGPWHDCHNVLESGEKTSGIYLLRPRNTNRLLQAWCDQSRAQGGWTVIQRRQDGSVNFFRTWDQYKQGFGNLDGEYWLGLEHLYWLTSQATYKLRVAMEDWQGRQVYAEYDSFRVEPESDWYRLRLGSYQGTAGDSLSWHNNKAFTTLDRDKDAYTGNCAHYQKGGWWYHMCAHSNLNGVWYRGGHYRSRYQDGVYWAEFHGGSYSLKKVAMMIKPA